MMEPADLNPEAWLPWFEEELRVATELEVELQMEYNRKRQTDDIDELISILAQLRKGSIEDARAYLVKVGEIDE